MVRRRVRDGDGGDRQPPRVGAAHPAAGQPGEDAPGQQMPGVAARVGGASRRQHAEPILQPQPGQRAAVACAQQHPGRFLPRRNRRRRRHIAQQQREQPELHALVQAAARAQRLQRQPRRQQGQHDGRLAGAQAAGEIEARYRQQRQRLQAARQHHAQRAVVGRQREQEYPSAMSGQRQPRRRREQQGAEQGRALDAPPLVTHPAQAVQRVSRIRHAAIFRSVRSR
ncbi:hypothetical protein CV_0388 [Chromobacterium violaceum ATCC 12472]|uniref:Uncharacterized protein n=1 Tax=Chromobacterium violaceum (strain ATCC 12472 / DSM 30191 / JCM 1249 / CCUG 213 / NBRC 12614 / NCIMB 9131 / NCTC 9757 / MK) TaxID=243365 RepID=Q7P126_CHRVO|nr:hypothetical protein CV_0388 [Chromobacterium violaceum ATCC 12472]